MVDAVGAPRTSVLVRDACEADAPAIAKLLACLGYPGPEAFVPGKIRGLLQHPDARLLVAQWQEEVVGVLSLHFITQLALEGDFCRIGYLCVAEGTRSLGVGALLEATTETLARARGCDRIEVHCHSRRIDAHRFYFRQGFEESPKYLMKRLQA